jgi:hypothetical protein
MSSTCPSWSNWDVALYQSQTKWLWIVGAIINLCWSCRFLVLAQNPTVHQILTNAFNSRHDLIQFIKLLISYDCLNFHAHRELGIPNPKEMKVVAAQASLANEHAE